MNTTQNRADVCALFLRKSVETLRKVERRVDDEAVELRRVALAQIDGVADELETVAAPACVHPQMPTTGTDGDGVKSKGVCPDCGARMMAFRVSFVGAPDPDGAARG